ncbi:NADPH-dependent glutamate synthase [Anaerorhabdus furcosa]|uniref:Sulfide dehydrogenase (Flavoprotein) subunit SudA n=1 Tax=Anaerorhabdus furcosa TaxID=118967 RepID=A0A1T4Q1L8_9FIRM|nr:NADPH-dependent glutamate synthase [Anaerorhabdus furcosa]SJZ97652.1 sulfide dehydrogenase (flavoprotein) subunit SudA [Anaerorhabdus furcosa]
MANMQNEKTPMPFQDPTLRSKNFEEVALGYTHEMAINEAQRCLNCKHKPCMEGCPVGVHIPEFIQYLVNDQVDEALREIKITNNFPSICGRVCPQESQCEAKCVRGIKGEAVAIGRLERYVAEQGKVAKEEVKSNGIKVGVIGSGPAGLSCANDCAKAGFDVTIFEALHQTGGVLSYGIPEFRLPKSIVQKEIESLKDYRVKIETNMIVGRTITFDDLWNEGFKALFIGTGAGLPNFMNIPNENAVGVVSANEYLTRCNLMKAYDEKYDTPIAKPKHTVVVGGGNVAMDAARCARRLGDRVTLVYRRSLEEMPARHEEIEHAMEEGIEFKLLTNPIAMIKDDLGQVSGMTCVQMELGEPDDKGRRGVSVIEGSEFNLDCDYVIMAIGTSSNPLLKDAEKSLEVNRRGCFVVNEDQMTSVQSVYAGGDAVSGAATVILAMGAGKKAAESICKELLG